MSAKIDISVYLKDKNVQPNKQNYGTCKNCGKSVYWAREKVASHKRSGNCTGIAQEEMLLFSGMKTVSTVVQVPSTSGLVSPPVVSSERKVGNPEGEKLRDKIDSISLAQKRQFDLVVADFFHKCNVPLSIADSEPFKNMLSTLRPAYANLSPSSKVIGGTMLSEKYDAAQKEVQAKVSKCSSFCLVTDGWSNKRNQHILNFIVVVPFEKPIFYKVSQ